jgi:hypothetical protein
MNTAIKPVRGAETFASLAYAPAPWARPQADRDRGSGAVEHDGIGQGYGRETRQERQGKGGGSTARSSTLRRARS